MKNNDSLATILLVSRIRAQGLRPLKASEYWTLREQVGRPGVLLGQTEQGLASDQGLSGELATRIVALLDRATGMAFELEHLEHAGVWTMTPFDDGFPQRLVERLGSRAPAVLHGAGEVEHFDQPGLGVVGSRDVSPEGGEVAKEVAATAVDLGFSLVSGGARGVDQLAMNAALGAGGNTIGVMAGSLLRRLQSADVRRAIHDERAVMCSPYSPKAPFRVWNAMGRNKLIYALSEVTVVVASASQRGGTWSGATEALRKGFGHVAVWRGVGEGPGNEGIEKRGARSLGSVAELAAVLRDAAEVGCGSEEIPARAGPANQISLF